MTGDLLYELVSVQKLDYQAACEMAMREVGASAGRDPRPQSSPKGSTLNAHFTSPLVIEANVGSDENRVRVTAGV